LKNPKNKFLQLPQIAGGIDALKKYIETNLVYPEEAKKLRIEGIIHLITEIDDNGKVLKVEIIKGLAGGCNDEAIRLIKNMQFGKVKNKGLRVKTKKQFKIRFQLPPESQIAYQFVDKKTANSKPAFANYSYTIQIDNP
jgi:TonB family protein